MSDEGLPGAEGLLSVEVTGESVGEAKWLALRELERQVPGLDRDAVSFQVVSEGERGILGVGGEPARVVASVDPSAVIAPALAAAPPAEASELARLAHEVVAEIVVALGVQATLDVEETDDEVTVSLEGADLGPVIGRHGQTIEAIQSLLSTIAFRAELGDEREVFVDAAGYRDRRRASLESLATGSAEQARRTGARVELEPMSSVDRRMVHTFLKEEPGVTTHSEGVEPARYIVVEPSE